MNTVSVNGKHIKTNLYSSQYPIWNGNDVPAKYNGRYVTVPFGSTVKELFDKLVAEGYTEIRFVETTTMVRGYHHVHAFVR